jgi:tripartite-type tricarboxylate transporter receptor subunit TctC
MNARIALSVLLLAMPAAAALAQPVYPTKPIRLIVGFAPGGTADIMARLLAEELRKDWGQPVIVDNRAGASGAIGADLVAKSAPDGYTLLTATATHTGIAALKGKQLPYDSLKDFTPITMVTSAPIVLVVRADSPFRKLSNYIAAAKAKPGEITYATSGIGGSLHLAAEQFAYLSGVKLNHIPYKGANQSVMAVVAGPVQSSWNAANAAVGLAASGKVHIVAVASRERSSLLPDTPTLHELGVKGMDRDTWIGLLGPARMSSALVKRIHGQVKVVITKPDIREKIIKLGAEPVAMPPAEFAAKIKNDIELSTKVVRSANITVD